VSDAGVAAWLARAGAEGGALNVAINLAELPEPERSELDARSRRTAERAEALHAACIESVRRRMADMVPSA
jgi:formiminotetrahydrofolate cyclodeaminase